MGLFQWGSLKVSFTSYLSVGVAKSMCTRLDFHLEYHTVVIKIDYTYTEIYPDPNIMTVAL